MYMQTRGEASSRNGEMARREDGAKMLRMSSVLSGEEKTSSQRVDNAEPRSG